MSGVLTERQLEIFRLRANGLSSKQAAEELGISGRTVEMHVADALRRLGAHNIVHAMAEALRRGIIQ